MTDEEKLAERYVNGIPMFAEEGEGFSRTQMQQAYLAGLEAGKPKWHKVADGDLPKNRHNVWITYINAYHQTETTEASFRHKYWVINGHRTECDVIAWCEIPKYTKE